MKKPKIKLPSPTDYQRDILNYVNDPLIKYITFVGSRQTGKSYLLKMLVTKWGLENKNKKIGYITPSSKLSKLFYSELINSLKQFVIETNATDLKIKFVSGTTLQFFSAESEDSIRGFQFNFLIIDEAAFIKNDTFQYIIRPTYLIKGEKVIMVSTPNGNSGFFFDFYNYGLNNEPGYVTKTVTIYDNPFVSKEEIELIKRQISEKVFDQEYLGKFLDGSGTVFSNYLNCVNDNPTLTGKYYAAIDWGKNDYTVLTIINNNKEVVEIYRINGLDYTVQVEMIVNKLKKYNPIQTISEENNIGTVVNEMLKKQYKGNLKLITLDNKFKKEMIENLIVGFETESIKIPNNDILLRELQIFTAIYNSSTQTVKYSAPNGHNDDTVISLAYAYHLCTNHNKTLTTLRF